MNPFYESTVQRTLRNYAEGVISCDVCVVGAGFTGLSAAIELAQRGLSVVVLEAERVGYGASGRNGGQICTGFSIEPAELVAQFGVDRAQVLFALSEEAKQIIIERNVDCDYKLGYLFAAKKPSALRELAERAEVLAQDLNADPGVMLDKAALNERLRSPAYVGGHLDPTAGQLNPLKYCLGLAALAEKLGVRIYERSAATEFRAGQVATDKATVQCAQVVQAGNAYLKPAAKTILPVASYVGATEPLTVQQIAETMPGGQTVCEYCNILNYYRIAPTGQLLFGAGATYSGRDPRNISAFVRKHMRTVFPSLAEVPFETVWTGQIAITARRMPELGDDGCGTYWARGFSGQGVALTGLAGRLIAEAICGNADRYRLLAGIPHRAFPGGRLLRAELQALAMSYYRLRDWMG